MAPIQVAFHVFPAVFDLVQVISVLLKVLAIGGLPPKAQNCAPGAGDWHTIKAALAETATSRKTGSAFVVLRTNKRTNSYSKSTSQPKSQIINHPFLSKTVSNINPKISNCYPQYSPLDPLITN